MEFRTYHEVAQRRSLLEEILREPVETEVSVLAQRLANDDAVLVISSAAGSVPQLALAARTQAGQSSFLWPPKIIAATNRTETLPEDEFALRAELLRQACTWLRDRHSTLAQSLLDPQDVPNRTAFQAAGFHHLADLAYIGAEESEFPRQAPAGRLQFEPIGESLARRSAELAGLLKQTYTGTQDCPAIGQFQSVDNTLDSYRDVGQFDPNNWFFVRQRTKTVGCLILAQQTTGPIPAMELIYMGIVPDARGSRLGVEIVQFAQWKARECGAERLVLAVDSNNQPALAMYAECGFGLWGQRSAMIKKLEPIKKLGS